MQAVGSHESGRQPACVLLLTGQEIRNEPGIRRLGLLCEAFQLVQIHPAEHRIVFFTGDPAVEWGGQAAMGVYWRIRLTSTSPGAKFSPIQSSTRREFSTFPGRIRWRMMTPRVIFSPSQRTAPTCRTISRMASAATGK